MTIRFKKRLASISVRLEDKVVYLSGSSDDEPEEATPETAPHSKSLLSQGSLLRGTVCIKVTSSCSFRHLRVVLVGVLRTFAFAKTGPEDNGLAAQSHVNLRHEVNVLDERSPHFQPGVHELPFAVLLPPSLQSSFRCPYGRQEYSVYAIAEEVDGKQHTAEAQIVNLLSPGETCNRPLLDVVTYNDSLGFISATMHCDIPRIGGQAFLQIEMPRPKPDITLVSILVSLVQTVRVTWSSGMSVARTGERQLARCWNAAAAGSADPLKGKIAYAPRWKQGQPVSLAQNVWLPTHATFAPSSNASALSIDTKSRLRMTVSHHAVIKIRFVKVGEAMKEVTITSRNVFLLSCKCLPNSLVLPPYSPETPLSEDQSRDGFDWLSTTRKRHAESKGNECTCFAEKGVLDPPFITKTEASPPRALKA